MMLRRRQLIRLATGAVALPFASRLGLADGYPSRAVRVIVGLPAGNSPDIVARVMAQRLSERLGQPFVVENRPGAATSIATEIVVRAAADGYTLLLALAGNTVNQSVYKNLNYDFSRDIVPVASIGGIPLAMVVNPAVPATSVPEFIAYAKANPGKLLMASSGNGSLPHIFGALFAMMAGIDLVHVPYKESVFPDLLGGQVQLAFEPAPAVVGYINADKLRPLAVTTKERLRILPNVPTVGEFLPGYEGSGWIGLGAPRNTPNDVIEKLNAAVNAGLADTTLEAKLAGLGVVPIPMTAAEFKDYTVAETAKWAKVVAFAHITAE